MDRRKIRRKIRHSTPDCDDDTPLFGPGSKIQQSMEEERKKIRLEKIRKEKREAKRETREKAVPKPTRLDKALAQIKAGASDVNLIHLELEPSIDSKLASLIDYVKTHQHVLSVELQAINISF